ncbi:hypothetical protein MCOR25_004032 [Pyricularia grisea]|uniref:Elongation factor methyltransferase 7 n=1 Tax=Pyricularia grisea TaxID=148305 RepID=A0A6P8AWR4_PYRGI|nr:uncharacterized protein PgNI_08659 [Pyricularia grisea]KAI6371098.1 hypothetical protein MCOR25_004032 [Pyricularia grisea]TLD06671.1 hypothetical protein PgNI_08659 [Pyricularia grisea]
MADQKEPKSTPPHQDEEDDLSTGDMFAVPEGYYPPPPPPRTETHTLSNGTVLTLHLVGHSVMDAHHVWNGGRVLADHFLADPSLVAGKTVLEVGAGAGIPSLVAAHLGAAGVVSTDYPDPDVLVALRRNVDECDLVPQPRAEKVVVDGYVWGKEVEAVLAKMPGPKAASDGVDVLIMADLLFRHTEHENIALTIERALKRSKNSRAYVFFTSYRPWLRERDLKFFDVVRDRGFVVEKVLEKKMDTVMFKGDAGDEEVRKTCDGYVVTWPEDKCID